MSLCAVFTTSEAADTNSQIAIVGGGLSGTLAAAILGRAGYDVCLIDRHAEYPVDFRAEHLDGDMIAALRRLELLDQITFGLYRGETVALARHGKIVGTAETVNYGLRYEALVNRARALLPPNVSTVTGRVTNIQTSTDVQRVQLADGRVFTARLIVLATGQGYALTKLLNIRRKTLREGHSLTFGFEVVSLQSSGFPHPFVVYQREKIEDRIDYFAAFTMGSRTRVNLFTYRAYKEPWTKSFIANPDAELRRVLPGLESVIGPYQALGPVEARPVDLYVSENVAQDGVVVVGDAYQSSCPATGMGILRLLTDIEQLSQVHIPRWLATPGMSAGKLASFYQDSHKQACDAKALHDSEYRRRVSTELSLGWRMHRARVHTMERLQAMRHRQPTARHPRIVQQPTDSASLAPG